MTPDTSGPAWRTPLAYYDPEECCWKTSGVMFPSDWPTSSQTCPAWGMTRGGELFELPTPALPTAEPASSSSLPTPRATRGGSATETVYLLESDGLTRGPLLPTPVVNDMGEGKTPEDWDAWTGRMQEKHGNGNGPGPSLSIEAQKLLPTPCSQEPGGTAEAHLRRKNRLDGANRTTPTHLAFIGDLLPTPTASDTNGVGEHGTGGPDLRTAVSLLPTPAARDWKDGAPAAADYRRNSPPIAVLLSPGEPTNPPFDGGSTSPDEQPQDLLSLLDEESA